MRWFSLAGALVLLTTAACGTDPARPQSLPDHAGDAVAAASAAPTEPVATAMDPAATEKEKPGAAPSTAKPSAPAVVTASLRSGAADLEVVFGADGAAITIQVSGVDGLRLTGGAAPLTAIAVRGGQTLKLSVQYDAPPTESNLAVSVRGTFAGREQIKVQSFTINPGSRSPDAQVGESKIDKDNRRIKVVKPQ